MKLKDYVDNSIMRYPTLFRSFDYEHSRRLVLNHMFLAYGTGLEWSKEGFLAEERRGKFKIEKPRKIPENYFTMPLWEIDLRKKDVPEFKKMIKGNYHYLCTSKCEIGEFSFVFSCDKKLATKVFLKFDEFTKRYHEFLKKFPDIKQELSPRECCSYYKHDEEYKPHPMCKYSPIVEMINKQTDSPHIENFKLNSVQADYIEGAIEIVSFALDFYKDPKRNVGDYYHPSNALKGFKELYDKDPDKFRKERVNDGMLPEHTIEEWCEICWQRHLKEQMKYCQDFLNIYASNHQKIY